MKTTIRPKDVGERDLKIPDLEARSFATPLGDARVQYRAPTSNPSFVCIASEFKACVFPSPLHFLTGKDGKSFPKVLNLKAWHVFQIYSQQVRANLSISKPGCKGANEGHCK